MQQLQLKPDATMIEIWFTYISIWNNKVYPSSLFLTVILREERQIYNLTDCLKQKNICYRNVWERGKILKS